MSESSESVDRITQLQTQNSAAYQSVGREANPNNFLIMHAMGPNVAGVIGSAIAAGLLLAML